MDTWCFSDIGFIDIQFDEDETADDVNFCVGTIGRMSADAGQRRVLCEFATLTNSFQSKLIGWLHKAMTANMRSLGDIKWAMVVGSGDENYVYRAEKMFSHFPFDVRVFRSQEAAAKWLAADAYVKKVASYC